MRRGKVYPVAGKPGELSIPDIRQVIKVREILSLCVRIPVAVRMIAPDHLGGVTGTHRTCSRDGSTVVSLGSSVTWNIGWIMVEPWNGWAPFADERPDMGVLKLGVNGQERFAAPLYMLADAYVGTTLRAPRQYGTCEFCGTSETDHSRCYNCSAPLPLLIASRGDVPEHALGKPAIPIIVTDKDSLELSLVRHHAYPDGFLVQVEMRGIQARPPGAAGDPRPVACST